MPDTFQRLLAPASADEGPASGPGASTPGSHAPAKGIAGEWLWLSLVTFAAAPYGTTIGLWTSPRLALYTTLKLPLVLQVTALLTLPVCWLLARLAGCSFGLREVTALIFLPLAVASVILLSLSPVTGFFAHSIPEPDTSARTTHNLLYLLHTTLVGTSALGGIGVLLGALRRRLGSKRRAASLVCAWTLVYAIVGGEVAWALRPFVGSIYHPVTLFRSDALDGNVYEFVLEDIVPYLRSGQTVPGGDP